MMRFPVYPVRQRGFTLIEAVMVIVITGILGAIVAVFIRAPIQNYVDSAARAELTDMADLTLRRMARELRLALPNSIRVSADGKALEFIAVKTGGRYLGAGEWPDAATSPLPLDFVNGNTSFTAVGSLPVGRQTILTGDSIVVYNLGADAGVTAANAYNGTNRAVIDVQPVQNSNANWANTYNVTMKTNTFTAELDSQSYRFQVITTPVSYFCDGTSVRRFSNYAISAVQSNPPTGTSALLSNNVIKCTFSFDNLTRVRIGLIGLSITMQMPGSADPPITLVHQIHVDNSP